MADRIRLNLPGAATRIGQEDTTAVVQRQGMSNHNANEKEKNGSYSREEFAQCQQNVRHLHGRLEMEQDECVLAKARAKLLERKVADLERKLNIETLRRKEVEAFLAETMARLARNTFGRSQFSTNTVVEEISEPQTPCSQSEQESSSSKPGNLNSRKREKEGGKEGSTTTSNATTPKVKGSEDSENYNLRGYEGVLDWTEGGLKGLQNKVEAMELVSGKMGNNGPSATWEEVAGLLVEKRDARAMFERRLSGIWRQMGEEMGALAEVRGQEEQVMVELMAWMSHLVRRLQETNEQHGPNYSDPNYSQDENLKPQGNGANSFAFGRTSEPPTFAEREGLGNEKGDDPRELSFRWSYVNGHSDDQQVRGLEGPQNDQVLLERGQYQSSLVEGGVGEGEAHQNVMNSWHSLRGRSTLGENLGGRETGSIENQNQGPPIGNVKNRDNETVGDVKGREMEERGEPRTEIKSGWEENKNQEEQRSENDTQAFQKRTSKRPPDYQKYVEPSATDLVEKMGSYGRDFASSNPNNNHQNLHVPNFSNRNVENVNAMSASVSGRNGSGNGNGRVNQSVHLEEVKKWGEKPPVGPSRKMFVEPSATDLVDNYHQFPPNGSISAVSAQLYQPQSQEADEYFRGQSNSAEINAGGEREKEREREMKEGKIFEDEQMNYRPSEGSRGQYEQSGQGGRVMGEMHEKQISHGDEYSYDGEMESGKNGSMRPSTTQTTATPQFSGGGGGGGGVPVQDQYKNSETNRRGNMESETGWDSGGHISSSGVGQVRGGGGGVGNKEVAGNNLRSRSWTAESVVYDGAEGEGSPSLGRQFSSGEETGLSRQLASQFYSGPSSRQRSNPDRVLQVGRSGGESGRGGRLTPLNIPLKPAYLRAPSSSSSNQGSGSHQGGGGGEKRGGKFAGVEGGPVTLWESPREIVVREAIARDSRMSDVLRAIQSVRTEISSVMDNGDVRDGAQGGGREALEPGSEGGGGGNAFITPGGSRDDYEFAMGVDPRAGGGGGGGRGGSDNNFSRLRSTSYGSDGGLGKGQETSGNVWSSRGDTGRKANERDRSGSYFVTSPMASVQSSTGFGPLLGNNNFKAPNDPYREYGPRKGAPPSISFHPPLLKTMNGTPPPFPPSNNNYVGPAVGLKGQQRERGWAEEGMTLVTELGNSGKDFLQFGPPGGGGGREPLFHPPLVHIPSSSRSSTAAKESESASLAGDSERGQRRD